MQILTECRERSRLAQDVVHASQHLQSLLDSDTRSIALKELAGLLERMERHSAAVKADNSTSKSTAVGCERVGRSAAAGGLKRVVSVSLRKAADSCATSRTFHPTRSAHVGTPVHRNVAPVPAVAPRDAPCASPQLWTVSKIPACVDAPL